MFVVNIYKSPRIPYQKHDKRFYDKAERITLKRTFRLVGKNRLLKYR